MSTVKITATTDGRYIGHEFDEHDLVVHLAHDVQVQVERVMQLPNGVRFINTTYIIDAVFKE